MIVKLPVLLISKDESLENIGVETEEKSKRDFIRLDLTQVEAYWDYSDDEDNCKIVTKCGEIYIIQMRSDQLDNIITQKLGYEIETFSGNSK